MKRIDEKIKEIEKKDKRNNILFAVVILLIAAFIIYALKAERTIATQGEQLSQSEIEKQGLYKNLLTEKEDKEKALNDLENSLKPEEYWAAISKANSVEGYLEFITNDWGIKKSEADMEEANNILETGPANLEGYSGWLWVGSKNNAGTYTTKNIVEVIYRKDAEGDFANSEPKKGDIVRLKTTANRNTYSGNGQKGFQQNTQGWRNKTKAYVADIWLDPNSINFEILIRYY